MFKVGDRVCVYTDISGDSEGPCKGGIINPNYTKVLNKESIVFDTKGTTFGIEFLNGTKRWVYPWRLKHLAINLENE